MFIELTRSLFSWIVIFPIIFSLGFRFQSLIPLENKAIKGTIYCAIGMACLSYLIVVLSVLHLLNPVAIRVALVVLFLVSLKFFGRFVEWIEAIASEAKSGGSLSKRILLALFSLSSLALLVGTLSPEIGGDALCYHLNIPKNFLIQGSIKPDYFDLNSYFPMLLNNLYLIGLATGGPWAAKVFHFLMGFLLFVSLVATITEETNNRSLAWFFGLVFWVTPTLYNILSTTYNDGALAFYVFIALYVLLKAFDQTDSKLFFLSGFLLGCAMAIKYIAMVSFFGFLGVWLYQLITSKGILRHLINLSLWAGGFFVVAGFWLLRNWIIAGNPVFPYFGNLFGTQVYPTHYGSYGIGKTFVCFLTLFWDMFWSPTAFGSFGSGTGIFYVLFIPIIIFAAFYVRRSRGYAFFTLFFLVALFYVGQAHRYALPVLPVMCVAASLGVQKLYLFVKSNVLKIATTFAGAVILMVYVLGGLFHYRYAFLLYVGYWSPAQYLLNMERTIPIANWVNENLPSNSKILIESEPRRFYMNRPSIRDVFLKFRTAYDQKNMTAEEMNRFFKSYDITHLLVTRSMDEEKGKKLGHLDVILNSPEVTELVAVSSQNIRDEKFIYHLYQLN